MDKKEFKAILNMLSGVKYHFVACMAICKIHYKLEDLD